jgi:nitrite reductase/ring-hydroxylating ferredoxin subunit
MTWYRATEVSALEDKAVVGVDVNGHEIAIYKIDGEYFATANICTHQFAFMSEGFVEGSCIECPLHQALFDIKTGAVIEGPADQPLKTYSLKVDGTALLVELPD